MRKKIYIETYGCQMNFADSEIIASLVKSNSFDITKHQDEADIIFFNTCAIREHAEKRVLNRIREFKSIKKKNSGLTIGILGCMAERLKEKLATEGSPVDIVIGPDSYRRLPEILKQISQAEGEKFIDVVLSEKETYEDIIPENYLENNISAYISIMRGCENYCSYCVVPYVRGKERSRPLHSILKESERLIKKGIKEITLLGQNVNSYQYKGDSTIRFPELLSKVAALDANTRIRFATSHPKDLSDDLLGVIAANDNICKHIHLPVQSGSNTILKRMNRKYTRADYLNLIDQIRRFIPDTSITTDIITGFPGETQEDHEQTLDLMKAVGYDFSYMFYYSSRPETAAVKLYNDDVPLEVKKQRLTEIISLQNHLSLESNKKDIGKTFTILAEKPSKKSEKKYSGRNSQNKVCVFSHDGINAGTYLDVEIIGCTSATLLGAIKK